MIIVNRLFSRSTRLHNSLEYSKDSGNTQREIEIRNGSDQIPMRVPRSNFRARFAQKTVQYKSVTRNSRSSSFSLPDPEKNKPERYPGSSRGSGLSNDLLIQWIHPCCTTTSGHSTVTSYSYVTFETGYTLYTLRTYYINPEVSHRAANVILTRVYLKSCDATDNGYNSVPLRRSC